MSVVLGARERRMVVLGRQLGFSEADTVEDLRGQGVVGSDAEIIEAVRAVR